MTLGLSLMRTNKMRKYAILLLSTTLFASLGCYQTIPSSTTETWRCFAYRDWAEARILYGRNPRGNGVVQLTRSLEGSRETSAGTVTTAGVTYQAVFKLVGTTKLWTYISQGREAGFLILPDGQGSGSIMNEYGERHITTPTTLRCVSP